jgi:hypothetical protein
MRYCVLSTTVLYIKPCYALYLIAHRFNSTTTKNEIMALSITVPYTDCCYAGCRIAPSFTSLTLQALPGDPYCFVVLPRCVLELPLGLTLPYSANLGLSFKNKDKHTSLLLERGHLRSEVSKTILEKGRSLWQTL